jgi:hypothetical protein
MNDKVRNATETAAYHMEQIQGIFKTGSKITLVVRPPTHRADGDTDFVMTDDDLDAAIAVLQRRKARGNEAPK